MNAQNSTSITDFTAILNASVEEQVKIQKAVANAKKALDEANLFNAARKQAANVLVSKIQADLNKQLVDAQKMQQEAYEKSMVELGMSAQVYPLETAALAIDQKVFTPVLKATGKVGKFFAGVGQYIGSRTAAGFKS